MRRTRVMALLAAGGFVVAGCSAPGPAEVTFFADGKTVNVTPLAACDPKTGKCSSDPDAAGKLKVRPGKPVQISVPGEIADSLWKVTAQYVNAKGEPQPLQETLVTSRDRYAYTVTPPSASDQILVVEIAQAAAISRTGNPEDAEPITIALWSLQIDPAPTHQS
ncbi:DUF2771 family protein [Amycolatopsis sp. H20-H5]|uniref:DUF2771 family protein n=1 Tax=Amycolatopsis sp. H20-H5 TaxID=3046309 RepID=UPI002DBDD573|nr:DUF2771 family protein [Amycolatopsis sp. H20-H5]MEC3978590.1 DUF2771 family protein [Amycolatopsis sp. H20-H5]